MGDELARKIHGQLRRRVGDECEHEELKIENRTEQSKAKHSTAKLGNYREVDCGRI